MRGWVDSKAKTCARAALRALVRLWPAESLEWGHAIAAELESVENGPAVVLWALGGVVVFAKALWKSFWHSLKRPFGVPTEGGEEHLLVSPTRGPRTPRWVTVLFLACAVALLLLPEARQGMGEVLDSWVGFPRFQPKSDLIKLAKEAEKELDAQTLAFAAIQLRRASIPHHSAESVRFGEEAIALDPSLTWIYLNLLDVHYMDAPIPAEWVKRLEQWDPQNAVPHLLEAERIAREFRAQWKQAHSGMNFPFGAEGIKLLESQPNWLAAMERAIESPRFDSYMIRHSEMNREVMRRRRIEKPMVAGFALMAHPLPQFYGVMPYLDLLVERAGEAERAGDLNAAADTYWRVAHFAEHLRVQGQSPDIQTLLGANIQKRVYGNLESVLKKKGQFGEAELVSYNLAEAKRTSPQKPQANSKQLMWDAIVWLAMLVHISAAGLVLAGSAVIFSFVALLSPARRWVSPRARGLVCFAAEFAPVVLLFCCVAFALSYYPFAKTFKTYLNARQEITDLRPFVYSLTALPSSAGGIMFPLFGQRIFTVYFWWGVIAIGTLLITWMLIRMFRPPAAHSEA